MLITTVGSVYGCLLLLRTRYLHVFDSSQSIYIISSVLQLRMKPRDLSYSCDIGLFNPGTTAVSSQIIHSHGRGRAPSEIFAASQNLTECQQHFCPQLGQSKSIFRHCQISLGEDHITPSKNHLSNVIWLVAKLEL